MSGFSRIFFVFSLAFLIGCASHNAVIPPIENPLNPAPIAEGQTSNRSILAVGQISFDPQNLTAYFITSRNIEAHYNVTPILNPPKCPDCVKIKIVDFKPDEKYVKLTITLKNPTGLKGYDIRGIATTNDPEIRLLNADAYTALWDDSGAVTINPFKAYWTNESDRSFEGHGESIREYEFTYNQLWSMTHTVLVVDASWKSHAEEPYDIVDQTYSGNLTTNSSSAITVSCYVLDWQKNESDIELNLSDLGQTEPVPMTLQGSAYQADVTGITGLTPGEYTIRIEAGDQLVQDKLYDNLYVDISIGAPDGFKLKPGETFVEASWDDAIEGTEEFHLYKREYGQDYNFANPIVISDQLTTYTDEDVKAGHMYYYKLSAVYKGVETDLTSEHGARPFKWGPIIAVSHPGGPDYYPQLNRGLDNSVWAVWNSGAAENLDELVDPDWRVNDYTLMPGGVFLPNIFIDQDGYVYICGADTTDVYLKIRFIKCHPYDKTPVLIDKDICDENDIVYANTVEASMDQSGLIHLVFEKRPVPDTSPEVFHCTVDKDGNRSEFEQISSGKVDGQFYYSVSRPGIFASQSGKVHAVWLASYGGNEYSWRYRVLSDGKWGDEEIVDEGHSGEIGWTIDRKIWEDPGGIVYFACSGSFYYYRDNEGWHGWFLVSPDDPLGYDQGGGVTGDEYGNAMFVYGFAAPYEIKYRQLYGADWSDNYMITTGHTDEYGPNYDLINVTTDKDGLAVIVWADQIPYGYYGIFARRQIME